MVTSFGFCQLYQPYSDFVSSTFHLRIWIRLIKSQIGKNANTISNNAIHIFAVNTLYIPPTNNKSATGKVKRAEKYSIFKQRFLSCSQVNAQQTFRS